jgi:hypothetical protein
MATNDNYDPEKEKAEHDAEAGLGTAAATGLGCLGVALLPWSLLVLFFLILIIAWFFYRASHGA